MGWVMGLAVYGIIWWTLIFMILPWGVKPIDRDEVAKGHAFGAPKQPRLVLKMALNTVLSAAVWGIVYWIVESGVISFAQP